MERVLGACKAASETYQTQTLTSPNPQVVDKSADAVLDEVEAAIFLVAASILRGEGFSYSVPSRAKGNQLCARIAAC